MAERDELGRIQSTVSGIHYPRVQNITGNARLTLVFGCERGHGYHAPLGTLPPRLDQVPSLLSLIFACTCAGCYRSAFSSSAYQPQPAPPPPYSSPADSHTTVASWYGPGFNGHHASSQEIFNQNEFTAASRTLPFGTYARVTNMENGQSAIVRVNDHGPYVRGRGRDLSEAAAERLGFARYNFNTWPDTRRSTTHHGSRIWLTQFV